MPRIGSDEDLWANQRREVRELLDDIECTQRDLAVKLGISEKHMSQILNARADGSIFLWAKIAEALELQWVLMPKRQYREEIYD